MDHRRVRVHAARIHSGETVMRIDVNPQVFATCLLRVCRVFAACLPRVCCVFAACLLRVCCVFAACLLCLPVLSRGVCVGVCWCGAGVCLLFVSEHHLLVLDCVRKDDGHHL